MESGDKASTVLRVITDLTVLLVDLPNTGFRVCLLFTRVAGADVRPSRRSRLACTTKGCAASPSEHKSSAVERDSVVSSFCVLVVRGGKGLTPMREAKPLAE